MSGKRNVSVTVKMSAADLAALEHAAGILWPKAILTRSSMVLGLAKLGAETGVVGKKKGKGE